MRAYRHSRSSEDTGRRLSQSGLLDLMGQVDPKYLERHDHSTVVRWESGKTLPTRERLEVFGRALDLSATEIEGLTQLAGLEEGASTSVTDGTLDLASPAGVDGAVPANGPERVAPEAEATSAWSDSSPAHRQAMRYAWPRFILPGSCVALAGYFMAMLGWNSSFMLAAYVGIALFALTAQGFWRLRRTDDLAELFFVTVFFQLSIPLLHAPLTRMDAYGLYSLGGLAGTSIPFTLSLIANLAVSTAAGLMFILLRRWQYSGPTDRKSAYSRAAWIVLPPIAFVYAFLLAFSNVGFWIVGLALFTLLAGVFTTLVVLRDPEISVGEWDRRFMLCTAVTVVIVLSALGLGAILVTYMQPSSYAVTDQGLFYSWKMDFDALGYSADEYVERSRLAVAWASLTTLAYMIVVIGGKLIVTIYRLGGGDSSMAASASAVVTDHSTLKQRTGRRSRLDLRHWAGCLVNLRVVRLRGSLARFLPNSHGR